MPTMTHMKMIAFNSAPPSFSELEASGCSVAASMEHRRDQELVQGGMLLRTLTGWIHGHSEAHAGRHLALAYVLGLVVARRRDEDRGRRGGPTWVEHTHQEDGDGHAYRYRPCHACSSAFSGPCKRAQASGREHEGRGKATCLQHCVPRRHAPVISSPRSSSTD